jgi:hypothetical protein
MSTKPCPEFGLSKKAKKVVGSQVVLNLETLNRKVFWSLSIANKIYKAHSPFAKEAENFIAVFDKCTD